MPLLEKNEDQYQFFTHFLLSAGMVVAKAM
jgi:hypothetical protein